MLSQEVLRTVAVPEQPSRLDLMEKRPFPFPTTVPILSWLFILNPSFKLFFPHITTYKM